MPGKKAGYFCARKIDTIPHIVRASASRLGTRRVREPLPLPSREDHRQHFHSAWHKPFVAKPVAPKRKSP